MSVIEKKTIVRDGRAPSLRARSGKGNQDFDILICKLQGPIIKTFSVMVELLASELALARAWTSGEPGMGLYIGCQVNVVKRPF